MSRKRPYSDTDIGVVAAAVDKRRKIDCGPAQDVRSNRNKPDQHTSILDATQLHAARNRRVDTYEEEQKKKKQRIQPPTSLSTFISSWVTDIAKSSDFDDLKNEDPEKEDFEREDHETMSIPSRLKRTRSTSDASDASFQSDADTESGASRKSKSSIYKDPRYPTMMASKGCFMYDSTDGLPAEQVQLCTKLLTQTVPLPVDPLFEPQCLPRFRAILQDKSELRVCVDLHSRLVPSIEALRLLHEGKFENLVEGHNDRWLDATIFYAQLPQPDRTAAHRPSALTDQERRKLEATPKGLANFTARAGMMFPFAACEVKCGKEALLIADHANLNSMAVALYMMVELYQLAGNITDILQKCLGFSISHDDGTVRIYVHFAKIDGERVVLHRKTLRDYAYTDKECEDSRTSYRFFWNVCDVFAPIHLQLIKKAIERLPDPLFESIDSQTTSNPASTVEQISDALTPATSNPDAAFSRPNARQRVTNTALMQKLEQQQKDFMTQLEKQQKEARAHLEDQQKEAKVQLELQQKEAKVRLELQQKEAKEREDKLNARLEQLLSMMRAK